ncbi:MAG: amino acid adenylation domain-containing protein, partial [Gammaproteobacteria bacterium SHHR-1]
MPLSSPQMSIWLDIQTGRDASAYNLCELVELRGQLDVPVMIEAIVQSLTEADSLHLRFGVQQGVPVQSLGVAQADVAVVDLSVGYADEAQREACAWREIEALKARPFDLERGGLSRDRIIRLGPERHWWVRLYHHLVLDGFSGRLHASRTAALYNARLRGVEPAPSGLGDYRAFIAADAAYPASRAHGLDLAYWRERLAQGHRPARFGAGAGGPSASMPPHMLRRPVRPELIAGVKQISAQAGVTFYAVLLAAYLLFLGRHAGTFRPACALPLVNRRGRAERATLGHFVNVLPFGISLDEHHSFIALSQAVGRQLRSDLRHMRLGGGLMRAAGLDPWAGIGAGTGSGTGAGVATFNVLDYPSSQPFAGLEANLPLVLGVGPVEDLMLVVSGYQGYPPGAEARFCWWYNPAVHDAAAMAYRAEGFEALLQALCRDAQGDPAGLPLMGDGQAARIRDAEQGPALGEVVHVLDRIQAHVQRNPQARALSARQQSASYAELAQMAAAVAARLREAGIRPEEPVGLCLHPSIEVVAGFLGILLAGGASLQLDPQQPPAQLQGMIGDLGCRLLLVEASTRAMVAQGADLCLIELDARALRGEALSGDPGALWGALGGGQGGRRRLLDDRLICLLHTSGSSGRPKPVGLSARALAGRMDSMAREFGLGEADECSCVSAALGFDPWLEQVLLPLCTGSSLWLPERQLLLDGPAFWRELKRQGVTHFNPPVPSLLSVLLSADGIPEGLRLRRLVLGGERLSADLLARAQALLNPATIWNMYGPTEATIEATGWPLPGGVPGRETEAEIPIGRPLPGMVLRILDERLRRLPFGVPGEIYIGGAGLAQGYLNRAAETAERFIPDPYGPPGARLYRSGDLGLWRADGVVLFRGRRDEQVKLRGQRVELAHVEAVIKRQPGVEDGVVLFESNPYGGRLIAHVVGQVSAQALKAALKRELSAAAVPQTYVMHQALPLLPSGKLDRRGLADQARDRPTPGPRSPAPSFPASGSARRRALQRAIAAIWAELLDAEAPAVDANLFETGVHSLLVLAALPRLSALAGREVSAVEVFRYPSIAQLAAQLAAEPVSDLVPELAPELAPDPGKAEADRSVCLAPRVGRQASGADAELAIVGLALRVPGAEDVAQFWRNLLDGVDSVGQVDAAALRLAGLDPGLLQDPRFISAHGRIHGIEQFDPAAFGYSPGEAALIDPQQRLLLELALHALEDAACDPAAQGPVGAFVGLGFPSYLVDLLAVRLEPVGLQRYAALLGNSADHAATRLAYKLGLGGPAMAISSACSSGLVAVAQAAESLRAGRCRAALAGALSLGMNLAGGYSYAQGGIGSASGRCRPFDAAADGTLGGSGGAMLVLKRLTDALADGDCIHAIIRGIGLNNDGSAKAAFTAPGLDGQVACLRAALADAGVAAESIGFVEGHGTATALGDPIEVAALNQAYGAGERGSVLLGSVKGNIGHLDAAAGVIGLVKAVLAVREGRVPPTCHFTQGNPRIPFAEGPFRVNTQAEPWPLRQGPRRAGVSSFGVGGSNAHLIVEQAPERGETAAAAGDAQAQLLP